MVIPLAEDFTLVAYAQHRSLSHVMLLRVCVYVCASADLHKSYHTWRAALTTCELLGQGSQSFSCSKLQTHANLAFSQRLSNILSDTVGLARGRESF